MKNTYKVVLVITLTFAAYFGLQKIFFGDVRSWLDGYIHFIGLSHFLTYMIVGLPLFVGLGFLHGVRKIPEALGLDKSIKKALLFTLLCTSPMLIGYAVLFDFDTEITIFYILKGSVIAAFIEELFFRAILFGQIFRFTKLGFIPAIVFGALLFASGHLYQSQDLATMFGIFLTTFMGAVLFAWLYAEWNYNLWIPIFLHLFMNLAWMLFSVSENALGDVYANVFRILTIASAIGFTIYYKIKRGISFEINQNTLFYKNKINGISNKI